MQQLFIVGQVHTQAPLQHNEDAWAAVITTLQQSSRVDVLQSSSAARPTQQGNSSYPSQQLTSSPSSQEKHAWGVQSFCWQIWPEKGSMP